MKIAFFFIVVAISSCFGEISPISIIPVDADQVPKMECKLKMDRSQAEHIGAQLAQLLKLQVRMKDSGDRCQLWCLREKIFSIMEVMAIVTGCPCQVIARLMVTYLPAPWKPHTDKIEDALWRRNCTALTSMNFTEDDMTPTVMKTADALLSVQGHNSEEVLKKGVMSLAATSTAQEMDNMVRSASDILSFALTLEFLEASFNLVVQSDNSTVEIGGALKPVDNMDDPLANLGVGKPLDVIGGGVGGH